jgi:hypothetical protein
MPSMTRGVDSVLNFISTVTYYSESAEPQDYVNLAEETEFHPEIQEGRCSA